MAKISPSLLAADPACLGDAARLALRTGCDELHFDVMDGRFVPNLTFGPHILRGLARQVPFWYDVHLMLQRPLAFVEAFAQAGAGAITVHAEAEAFAQSLRAIRGLGLKAGASLRPGTPARCLLENLPLIDRVLLMTVEPGFGGQKLMPQVLDKARTLREMGFAGEIAADGGINALNASEVVKAGVGVLIMGTAFFGAQDAAGVVRLVHAL